MLCWLSVCLSAATTTTARENDPQELEGSSHPFEKRTLGLQDDAALSFDGDDQQAGNKRWNAFVDPGDLWRTLGKPWGLLWGTLGLTVACNLSKGK